MELDIKEALRSVKDGIMQALQCELGGDILEARQLYENSISKLRSLSKRESSQEMRKIYKKYLNGYENHVRALRHQISLHMFSRRLVKHIEIPEGKCGYSYGKLFGSYMNGTVTSAHIYEPHITDSSQFENLTYFIELLIKNCPHLMYIRLITRRSPREYRVQKEALNGLSEELEADNITFRYQFDSELEEARIIMSNGVLLKCSLGLHIYRPMESYLKLSLSDLDLRRCLAAAIDIYKTKPFNEYIPKA